MKNTFQIVKSQFAYQPHLGADDAMDGNGCTVRITSFDFYSAFNTIQTLLLREKLKVMRVDTSTIFCITDSHGRPQFVWQCSV